MPQSKWESLHACTLQSARRDMSCSYVHNLCRMSQMKNHGSTGELESYRGAHIARKKTAPRIDKSRFNNYRLWTCSVSPAQSTRKVQKKSNCCRHACRSKRRLFRLRTTIVSFCPRPMWRCEEFFPHSKNYLSLDCVSIDSVSLRVCMVYSALFHPLYFISQHCPYPILCYWFALCGHVIRKSLDVTKNI